eukprot:4312087-Amphidinium_carterae.1
MLAQAAANRKPKCANPSQTNKTSVSRALASTAINTDLQSGVPMPSSLSIWHFWQQLQHSWRLESPHPAEVGCSWSSAAVRSAKPGWRSLRLTAF